MKKLLIGILLIGILLFTACAKGNDDCGSSLRYDETNQYTQAQEEPANYLPINFQSYDEMTDFSNQTGSSTELNMGITNDKLLTFQAATSKISSPSLPVPCINEQAVVLSSSEEEPGITLFSSELYLAPWIWYRTCIDDQVITIRIMLDQDILKTFDEHASCSDIIKSIAPDAPNIDNYQNFTGYSHVCERQISTTDGDKIALVQIEDERDIEYISFIQNGFLVTLSGPQDTIASEWLEMFSVTQNNTDDNEHVTE